MKNRITLIFCLLTWWVTVHGQQYILFEKHKGLNQKDIAPKFSLSQNDIVVKSGDTTLHIFNLFYNSDDKYSNRWSQVSPTLNKFDSLGFNNVLLTAVPLIKAGEQLVLKKLSKKELDLLDIVPDSTLVKEALPAILTNVEGKLYNMPSLKTWAYGLIIKDGKDYFQIQQKVLVTQYSTGYQNAYFTNQFSNGLLIYTDLPLKLVSKHIIKTYRFPEIQMILAEMKSSRLVNQVYDRTYISGIDSIPGLRSPIFKYWEYPFHDGDVETALFNPPPTKLMHYHPGLGSFSFLQKIGVVNCTLDVHFKKKILYDQPLTFKIVSINALPLNEFIEVYNRNKAKTEVVPTGGEY